MTDDAWRFTPTENILPGGEDPRDPDVASQLLSLGYLILHEGKTFRQFDDHWGERPRYLVALRDLSDKPVWKQAARFYRAAYRNIAGPGDQNVAIWNLHPAGVLTGEKGPAEVTPERRQNYLALVLVAATNAFISDWLIQLRVRATVSQFMLRSNPIPTQHSWMSIQSFLSHSCLRLTCNHSGYGPLWSEQLGDVWRETGEKDCSWPVLSGDYERWIVRAAIDAVVADAYGLSREHYAHVLSTFKHTSYPKAPQLCLAMFDELKAIGLDVFTKKHDPYWDIPLNENLPQPVIDLPVVETEQSTVGDPALGPQFRLSDQPARQRAKRKQ